MEKGPSIPKPKVERAPAPKPEKARTPQAAKTADRAEQVVKSSGARKGLEALASGNATQTETPKPNETPKTPNDIYADMLHSAHETGLLKVGSDSLRGNSLTPQEADRVMENEYAQATLEFAAKYPLEAEKIAQTNPKMKEALDLIQKNAEQKQNPKSRENLALRKEVGELKTQVESLTTELASMKSLVLELNKNMANALQETDPSKKKLLLEIIWDLIKHLAISVSTETPLDLAKETAGQSQEQMRAA